MTAFAFTSPLHPGDLGIPASISGGTALLRPLRDGETAPQQAVFEGLSRESRYTRYMTGMPALAPSMLRALGAVDGRRHVAWLASVDGAPVGVARFVATGPCVAEVAFEVVDVHQGRGLGTLLLDTVTTVAAAFRIRRLQATVLSSNAASRRLLSQVGLEPEPDHGVLEVDGLFHLLARPRVDRPAVVSVAYAVRDAAAPDQDVRGRVA